MQIYILKTEHELLSAIAVYFIEIAKEAIAEQGAFNVALPGGNSPKRLYELL